MDTVDERKRRGGLPLNPMLVPRNRGVGNGGGWDKNVWCITARKIASETFYSLMRFDSIHKAFHVDKLKSSTRCQCCCCMALLSFSHDVVLRIKMSLLHGINVTQS